MIELKNFNEKEIPVYGEYDVVVVGGGMAGVGAAVAAGRTGAKTILVENTAASDFILLIFSSPFNELPYRTHASSSDFRNFLFQRFLKVGFSVSEILCFVQFQTDTYGI